MRKDTEMQINVLLPCFNEEASIGFTILQVRKFCPAARIVVIDNRSTDNTAKIATSMGVEVIYEPRQGKGFAFRRGINNLDPDCKYVFMVDGDDTYEISSISTALELIDKGFDMVIGSRIPSTKLLEHRSVDFRRGHKIGNRLLSITYSQLFGISLTDTLSGWRMMSRGFVNSFSGGASRFEIEAELNIHAYTLNAAVTEILVEYKGRHVDSHSKLNTYRDGWAILRRNLSLYKSERPGIAYSIISFPWLMISIFMSYRVGRTYLETQMVPQFPSLIVGMATFVVAGHLWATGMILERVRLTRVQAAIAMYRMN